MLSLGLPALHIAPFFLYSNVDKSVDMNDMDTQEQYFEVPHWMHLSFVSYNSDKTVFSQNQSENSQKADGPLSSNLESLEIRSNGFLLPRVFAKELNKEPATSPLLRPSAVLPAGSRKSFKFSSERQLIAGRDFRDILEACRPWNASTMPSPLRSLIESLSCNTAPNSNTKVDDFRDQSNCKEWGTLDYDYSNQRDNLGHRQRTVSLGQEPTFSTFTEEIDSQRSNRISHVATSSSVLPAPCERTKVSPGTSLNSPCIYLQRPISLDYSIPFAGKGEANSRNRNANSSDDECERGACEERQSFEDKMRLAMQRHDLAFASISNTLVSDAESSVAAETNSSRNGSEWKLLGPGQTLLPMAPGTFVSNPHPSVLGTTGYTGGFLRSGKPADNYALGNFDLASSAKASRLTGDAGFKGLSPIMLPPAASSMDNSDSTHENRFPMERRLINPPDYAVKQMRSDKVLRGTNVLESLAETKNQKRNRMSSRSLSVSPPSDRSLAFRNSRHSNTDRFESKLVHKKHQSKNGKKAFNPFRQKDEDEVLAKKSHNRRRWSQ